MATEEEFPPEKEALEENRTFSINSSILRGETWPSRGTTMYGNT